MKRLWVLMLATSLVCVSVGIAPATIIWDQPYDSMSVPNLPAQDFEPAFEGFTSFPFDDFTTSMNYLVDTLTVYGSDDGDPSQNIDVIGQIWDGLPGTFGGSVVLSSVSGTEDGNTHELHIDFGNQFLPSGNYWITAYVDRPFNPSGEPPGGQFYGLATTPVWGNEAHLYNPGGSFGFGTDPAPYGSIFTDFEFPDSAERDLAFTLEGKPVPEPATVLLFGTGLIGLAGLRRKIRK